MKVGDLVVRRKPLTKGEHGIIVRVSDSAKLFDGTDFITRVLFCNAHSSELVMASSLRRVNT